MDVQRMMRTRQRVAKVAPIAGAALLLLLAMLLAPTFAAMPWLLFGLVLVASAAWLGTSLGKVLRMPRPVAPKEEPDAAYVGRDVMDETGQPAGKTLRAEGEHVLLERNGKLHVVGKIAFIDFGGKLWLNDVDWAQAERAGEAWQRGERPGEALGGTPQRSPAAQRDHEP